MRNKRTACCLCQDEAVWSNFWKTIWTKCGVAVSVVSFVRFWNCVSLTVLILLLLTWQLSSRWLKKKKDDLESISSGTSKTIPDENVSLSAVMSSGQQTFFPFLDSSSMTCKGFQDIFAIVSQTSHKTSTDSHCADCHRKHYFAAVQASKR